MFSFFVRLSFLIVFASFPAFAGFKTQEDLDRFVAKEAASVYKRINTSGQWAMPEGNTVDHYKPQSPHWKAVNMFLSETVEYEKLKDVSATQALESLLELGGYLDCRIVQRIVLLHCVRKVLGDVIFNKVCADFKKEGGHFWPTGGNANNPFYGLLNHQKESPLNLERVGVFGYIANLNEYRELHPTGNHPGENGVIITQTESKGPLFVGFGSFFSDGGKTKKEVCGFLKEDTLKESVVLKKEPGDEESNVPIDSKRAQLLMKMRAQLHEAEIKRENELRSRLRETFEEQFLSRQHEREAVERFTLDVQRVNALLEKHLLSIESK